MYHGIAMALIEQLAQEINAAMKARDEARLSALRMIKSALMKQKVDSPKPIDGKALSEKVRARLPA